MYLILFCVSSSCARIVRVHLICVHLIGVHLMGVHLLGVHLLGVHLVACISYRHVSRRRASHRHVSWAFRNFQFGFLGKVPYTPPYPLAECRFDRGDSPPNHARAWKELRPSRGSTIPVLGARALGSGGSNI